MAELTSDEKIILVQYAIKKYGGEDAVVEKLKGIISEKDIQRSIDTLLGTQRVRRIGPDTLQNNESHTELPDVPPGLEPLVGRI